MLKDVDAIVYDIQDVGARYYTYTSTLGLCMEAAAEHKIPMFVLDRPNPVTGMLVDGPIADENDARLHRLRPDPRFPRHDLGRTGPHVQRGTPHHCDLTVIPMQGWHRWMWWDDTRRMWINPSPNMRNPTQALLYLGIGFLETSNVSVGRGNRSAVRDLWRAVDRWPQARRRSQCTRNCPACASCRSLSRRHRVNSPSGNAKVAILR